MSLDYKDKHYKRLIVLSDGTWQNEASATPTNILKLARCIASESDDGVQQVLYYDSGVGTGGAVDSIMGGAMGVGIDGTYLNTRRSAHTVQT